MTGQCGCCGTIGQVEEHHIGGRSHSSITVDVCPACHNLLTIADVYERSWKPGIPDVWRIGAGFLDLAATLAANAGLPVTMRVVAAFRDALHGSLASVRVSASVPEYPDCDDPVGCTRIIDAAMESWRVSVLGGLSDRS